MRWIVISVLLAGIAAVAQPVESDSLAIETPPIRLGDEAPYLSQYFEKASGGSQRPEDLFGTVATVIIFWVDACPWTFVNRNRLETVIARYRDEDVGFLFIELRWTGDTTGVASVGPQIEGVSLLLDPESTFTRAYDAWVAPQVFVFNNQRRLVYAGAIDDSPADEDAVQEEFLVEVLEALISGESFEPRIEPALGCIGSQDRGLRDD